MGKRKYTIDDWRAVRRALDAGGTIKGVAEETGVDRNAVLRWSHRDGPPERMWLSMEMARVADFELATSCDSLMGSGAHA